MPTCPFGWWLNTTPTWISATCGPAPPSRCRGSWPSIGSDAAAEYVRIQRRANVLGASEINDGFIDRMHVKFNLAAGGDAPEHFHREVEVRFLPPRDDLLVRVAAKPR